MGKTVLTYGTFDTMHWGHINLLRRAKKLAGDDGKLIVAVSTDEFNHSKGKHAHHDFKTRCSMVESIKYVDKIIPEEIWEQKLYDVKKYHVDIVVMGSDWENSDKFEYLKRYCEVKYLPRTESISSSQIRHLLKKEDKWVLS